MRWVLGLVLGLFLSASLGLAQTSSLQKLLLLAVNGKAQEVYLVLGNTVLGPQEVGRLQELLRSGARVAIFADRCPEPRIMAGLPYYATRISVGEPGKKELYLLVQFDRRFLVAQGLDPRLLRFADLPVPPASHERDLLEFSLGVEVFRKLAQTTPRCRQ